MRSIGIKEFLERKFTTFAFDGAWADTFGEPERNMKVIVVVCWMQGGKPCGEYAKQIAYMCDVKVHVHNFSAYPRSRFGGNRPFLIWDKSPKGGQQASLGL